jgi:DHHC palmitoyltransferase
MWLVLAISGLAVLSFLPFLSDVALSAIVVRVSGQTATKRGHASFREARSRIVPRILSGTVLAVGFAAGYVFVFDFLPFHTKLALQSGGDGAHSYTGVALVALVGAWLWVGSVYNLWAAASVPPDMVTDEVASLWERRLEESRSSGVERAAVTYQQLEGVRRCEPCGRLQLASWHHCATCGGCVRVFDHHCPYTGQVTVDFHSSSLCFLDVACPKALSL